jgi:hypothetical protein
MNTVKHSVSVSEHLTPCCTFVVAHSLLHIQSSPVYEQRVPALQAHHKPVQRNLDGTGEIDPIGDLKDCGDLYEELEWCLADHNRDFSKCQKQIKAVRACIEAQKAMAEAQNPIWGIGGSSDKKQQS